MPWCEDCAKYFAPSAMNADGTCPTCGRSLEGSPAKPRRARRNIGATDEPAGSANPPGEHEPITAKNLNLHKLAAGPDGDEEDMKAPWHFKLLLVLLALYLGWRVVQLFA